MKYSEIIASSFFFGILAIVIWVMWKIWSPFLVAVALAGTIVVISYPLYEWIRNRMPRRNATAAAILSTIMVLLVIVVPIFAASTVLVHQFLSFFQSVQSNEVIGSDTVGNLNTLMQGYVPGFEFDVTTQLKQITQWFTGNLGNIFTGTISIVLTTLVVLLGTFYLFKDGERLIVWITRTSPLSEADDLLILKRVAISIRSVVIGTVLVSVIQGIAATVGFSLFGIKQAVLWGSLATLGSLLPGIGTAVIMIPAIIWLFFTSTTFNVVGLLIWALVTALVVDNLVSPYLMSRGNKLHPFVVLVSVLGGISLFGPVGFIIGPVLASLLLVLLELYTNTLTQSLDKVEVLPITLDVK